jgi:hypothetical protein
MKRSKVFNDAHSAAKYTMSNKLNKGKSYLQVFAEGLKQAHWLAQQDSAWIAPNGVNY